VLATEFRRHLAASFARRDAAGSAHGASQLGVDVVPVRDLLLEALADAPAQAGEWILEAWRRWSVDPDHPDRAERLVLALGWLEARTVAGWGHRLAQEALAHVRPCVRAAAVRALWRWADPRSVAILRTAIAEANPALAAELHAARDELDPSAVPSFLEWSDGATASRRAWDGRRLALAP
jgi:hypothetical protein